MTQQAPVQTMLFCSQCGRSFGQSDLVQIAGRLVCGDCKPVFLNRVVAGGPIAAGSLPYAGVGIRFGARFVDGLVLIVPIIIIAVLAIPDLFRNAGRLAAFNGSFVLIALSFGLFYEVLMLRNWGATLGKMACGIKVVRPDGGGLSWGVSLSRFFMYNVVISSVPFINWILLITTAIMAGTDEQKRGLQDRVCDTRVIYKRSAA